MEPKKMDPVLAQRQIAHKSTSGKGSEHDAMMLIRCVPGFSSMPNPTQVSELQKDAFSGFSYFHIKFHIKFRQSGKEPKRAHCKLGLGVPGFSSMSNAPQSSKSFFHHFSKFSYFHIKFHIKFRQSGKVPKTVHFKLAYCSHGFSSMGNAAQSSKPLFHHFSGFSYFHIKFHIKFRKFLTSPIRIHFEWG
jgi:hypothetical protein